MFAEEIDLDVESGAKEGADVLVPALPESGDDTAEEAPVIARDEIEEKEKQAKQLVEEAAPEAQVSETQAEETTKKIKTEETAKKIETEETTKKIETEETARKTETEETARKTETEETAKKTEAEETAKKIEAEETAKKIETEETARKIEAEETARKIEAEETAKKTETEETAKKTEAEETAKKIETEETAKKIEAEETAKKIETEETAKKIETEETAKKIETEETAKKTEAEETAKKIETEVSEPQDNRAWYVIHCYSGYENKVKHNLEQRIETMQMQDQIFQVVVPTEDEIEIRDGKRRTVERNVFPGYILVQMILTDDSWHTVRNTPGVTGFVGMGNEPTPLRPEEVQAIMKRMEAEAPKIKVTFKQGQKVRIIDGPFNEFIGMVDEINMERAKVRVMVSFFGRDTPVELDFLQVEKA